MYRNLTHEEFLQRLMEVNSHYREGEFEVLGKYTHNRTPIEVGDKYGVCRVVPANLLNGNSRPTIYTAIDKESYLIEQFKEKRTKLYDYSKIIYKSQKTKIEIVCDKHGPFFQSPDTHKKGHGCFECFRERQMLGEVELRRRLDKVSDGNKYILGKAKRGEDEIQVTCKNNHTYKQKVRNFLEGYGCKECHIMYLHISNSKELTEDSDMTFYVLEMQEIETGRVIYKVGITKNIEKRIKSINRKGLFNVSIKKEEVLPINEAYDKEQGYIKEYVHFKARGLPYFGGHTECFNESVIDLDNWQYQHYLDREEINK